MPQSAFMMCAARRCEVSAEVLPEARCSAVRQRCEDAVKDECQCYERIFFESFDMPFMLLFCLYLYAAAAR